MVTSENVGDWKIVKDFVEPNYRAPLPKRFMGKAENGAIYDFAIDIPGQRSVLFIKDGYVYWDYSRNTAYIVKNMTCHGPYVFAAVLTLPLVNPMRHRQRVFVFRGKKGQEITVIRYDRPKYPGSKHTYDMNAKLSEDSPKVTIPTIGYLIRPDMIYYYSNITILTENEANYVFPANPFHEYDCTKD